MTDKAKRPRPGSNRAGAHRDQQRQPIAAHNSTEGAMLDAIASAMAAHGIAPANGLADLTTDGQLCRYRVDGDKAGSRNGWAVIYLDGVPAAAFGSWKHGVTETWRACEPTTEAERQHHRERMEQARRQREAEQAQRHQEAAARAADLWSKTRPADPSHPYLQAKDVPPLNARQLKGALVLPVYGFDRCLTSLQFIAPDGAKKLLTGGRKGGCFIPVAGKAATATRLLLCEGWATGATLHQLDPAALVLAAVDAHNLQAVAVGAHRAWPQLPIVVCADRDPVGESKARAAAIAVGGLVAMPQSGDFNDAMLAAKGANHDG
ncbi:toprim domain-containing protein [Halorhodospira halochloris]|uniref:toprim domain-containing protein n=1 Tax=Halorhodospira halochloris TaxID=1052 RepID=UPI001EE7DDCB|nr:toprim domain-containing protein [Halorhodospira halochloris]MCG5548890.1 toprim domain-containing protein [Halorhodospira halochloris]